MRSFVHGETYTRCQKYYTLKWVVGNQPYFYSFFTFFFLNLYLIWKCLMTKLVKEIIQRGLVIVPVIISVKTLIGTQCKVQLHQSCPVTRTFHGSCHSCTHTVGLSGPVHRTMGKSPGDVGLAPHPVLWASCSTWAFFFSLIFSALAHLNWKLSQPRAFSLSVLAMLTLLEHEIKEW